MSAPRGIGRPGHRIDVERVGELHEQGVPTWAIAERTGFSESAVARAVVRARAARIAVLPRTRQSSSNQDAVEAVGSKVAIFSDGSHLMSHCHRPLSSTRIGVSPRVTRSS